MDLDFRRYFYRGEDPQRIARSLLLVVGLVSILLLTGAFYLGEQAAYSGMGLDPQRYFEMQEEVPILRERVTELEASLELARTRREVDQQAMELLRSELAGQKEEIASLEEGLRFYRSLMAPGELAQGLSLRPLELVALESPGQYAFRIVAQQEARKHSLLRGELVARVSGMRDGEETSFHLADISDDVDERVIALRFRYFQSIEGVMSVPEGFEPRWVIIEASASSPRSMQVEERFPWRLKEKFTNVGS